MTRPATDPNMDYKALVRNGYDECASVYATSREEKANPELRLLIERLPPGAAALDIGCGGGVPICRELAKHSRVTGVDISPAMVAIARASVPGGEFICGDIMDMEFAPSSFDAVTSFYAIFHIPKEEHDELFRRIHIWLKPDGYVMTTVALGDESPYTEDDLFGVTMYWSNFGISQYRERLDRSGFTIIDETRLGHGFKDGVKDAPEVHSLLFAQKR